MLKVSLPLVPQSWFPLMVVILTCCQPQTCTEHHRVQGDTRGLEFAGKVTVLGVCTYLYTWKREVITLPAVAIPSDKGATPKRRSWAFLGVSLERMAVWVVTPN